MTQPAGDRLASRGDIRSLVPAPISRPPTFLSGRACVPGLHQASGGGRAGVNFRTPLHELWSVAGRVQRTANISVVWVPMRGGTI